jgi:hypothetical protein
VWVEVGRLQSRQLGVWQVDIASKCISAAVAEHTFCGLRDSWSASHRHRWNMTKQIHAELYERSVGQGPGEDRTSAGTVADVHLLWRPLLAYCAVQPVVALLRLPAFVLVSCGRRCSAV